MSFEFLELPKYQCIKTVQAARIHTLLIHVDGVVDMELRGPNDETYKLRMDADWNHKHSPDKGGYVVVYADGYTSYSPAEAFENGYVLQDKPMNFDDSGDGC